MTSELKVDKITPASGTNTRIGEAGDTTNLSAGTVTLPTSIITGATEKTSLVDADKFLIADSADSNAFKHVQKSNLPAGTHVLIDEQTTTSASTLTVTGMDSTYKRYMLDMIEINTSNDVDLYMRYVYSGGVISNSYYQFAGSGYNSGAGFSAWYSNGTNTIRLLGETIRHDAGDINSIRLWIDNPSSTTTNKRCFWMGGGQRTSNYTFSAQGSAHFNQSALRNAITGLQVYPSSNTFDSCTLKLYGVT